MLLRRIANALATRLDCALVDRATLAELRATLDEIDAKERTIYDDDGNGSTYAETVQDLASRLFV